MTMRRLLGFPGKSALEAALITPELQRAQLLCCAFQTKMEGIRQLQVGMSFGCIVHECSTDTIEVKKMHLRTMLDQADVAVQKLSADVTDVVNTRSPCSVCVCGLFLSVRL